MHALRIALPAALLAAFACDRSPANSAEPKFDIPGEIADSNNAFAFDLFARLLGNPATSSSPP